MEKPKKYEDRLMGALGFDEDDLDANQLGHFSAVQHAQLAAQQRRIATFMIADALVMVAWLGAAQFFWVAAATLPLLVYFVMPVLLVALVSHGVKLFRLWRDVHEDHVLSTEGRIDLSMHGKAGADSSIQCTLKVGEVKFAVKEDAFLAFKNGDPYALYYTQRTKKLLSAEWLRGEDNLLRPGEEAEVIADEPDDEIVPEATARQRRLSR